MRRAWLLVTISLLCGCKPFSVQLFVRDVPADEAARVESALVEGGYTVVRNDSVTPELYQPTVVYFPGRKSSEAAEVSADILQQLGYSTVRVEPFFIDNHEYSPRTIGIYLRASTTPGPGQALPGVQRASFSTGCDDLDIFLTLVDDGAFHLALESGLEAVEVIVHEGRWQIENDRVELLAPGLNLDLAVTTGAADDLFSPGRVRGLQVVDDPRNATQGCQKPLRRLMER
ncbi:hypothetical protein F3N42_06910 [Marinihelvus fidelis]|uniref:Uncharacterized protein n=1 Tax=Marinihelvus fidelis TaxID=2613842 RepID=A0A5N0TAD5_9GAMM|nr:hypothetical protein [Marinihelvus fidelis]KAA9131900.1 hypothetical protein F3N42_06910 [Marinihelvus fidelis]